MVVPSQDARSIVKGPMHCKHYVLGQPVRTEKSRTDTICLDSRSARKLRPEPMRPSNASRYQTSSVHRGWSVSHGGVHDTASRSPRYVGRDGEGAISF